MSDAIDAKKIASNIVTGLCVKRGQMIAFKENEWLEEAICKALEEVIEECAKVADLLNDHSDQEIAFTGRSVAEAIRALKSSKEGGEKT